MCVIYIIYLEVAFSKTGFSWCMVLGFQHAEVPVIKPFMQTWGGAAAPTARLGRLVRPWPQRVPLEVPVGTGVPQVAIRSASEGH